MDKQIKILYIDDNPMDRALVRDSLEKEHRGFKLSEASSREEFEKLIGEKTFDLVLTDFNILGFEGLMVLETVKKVSPKTPVIIVTGTGSEEIAVKAMKQGAGDYVIKTPGHISRLPITILSVLEANRIRLERKKAKKELSKINRIYRFISQINRLIVHTKSRDILFQKTCKIAIKYGKFRMAWIGVVDEKDNSLAPFSWAGNEDGYLDKLRNINLDNAAKNSSLLGIAYKTGEYALCNDIANDTSKFKWKKEALEREYKATIALPIKRNKKVVAILNLYSEENRFFDKKEIALLKEVVDDISFALDSFHAQSKNRIADEALKASENKFRILADFTFDMEYWEGIQNEIIYMSPSCERITGYSQKEFVTKEILLEDIIHPDDKESYSNHKHLVRHITQIDSYEVIEFRLVRKDNKIVDILHTCRPIFSEDGKYLGRRVSNRDISKQKRAETELKIKQEELQKFFNDDISGDFVTSPEGKILDCNSTFLKLFGFNTVEEAINFPMEKLYPSPNDRKSFIHLINSHKRVELSENEFVRLDGKKITVLQNAIGIFNDEGNLVKVRRYIIDITDRVEAEEINKKLYLAIEQSPASVVITNQKGEIEYANKKFCELSGYSSDEVVGNNPRILKSGFHDSIFYKNFWDTVLSGKNWQGEMQNKKKNGELYWEHALISPVLNKKGEIAHIIAVKEDITERKKKDDELKKALEKAQESDRLKSAFLANMSHEIRTPMNGILGFSNLLKEPGLSGEVQQEYIEIIEKSGARMLNTINDIIDISKIESGQVDVSISKVNLNEKMEFLGSFFNLETDLKGIQLSVQAGLPKANSIIHTDMEKLDSVLTNLIKNAVKYTLKGSIEFGYELINTDKKEYLQFFVKDTGIGIKKERQEAIFERFVQADIEDKYALQGSGLGLAISKAYVEILGGKIWVESEHGNGSVFYFTIPYNPVEVVNNDNTVLDPEVNVQNRIRKLNILIAEDDEPSEILLRIKVDEISQNIFVAKTGNEAVEICRNNSEIDLVLMDIQMPGINGYEATRQIRSFNKDVVIIAQTAYALTGDGEKAIAAGCNGYVSKPIADDELMTLIENNFTSLV